MVPDGNAQPGHDIQQPEHSPVQPGVAVEESEERHSDHGAAGDQTEEQHGDVNRIGASESRNGDGQSTLRQDGIGCRGILGWVDHADNDALYVLVLQEGRCVPTVRTVTG